MSIDLKATVTGAESALGGYRPHFDGLCAVAVHLVVLFHAGVDRAVGGFIVVDVFFVLSGLVVTSALLIGMSVLVVALGLASTPLLGALLSDARRRGLRGPFRDIDALVCPDDPICSEVVGGLIVRWDFSHLTTTSSEHIGPELGQALSAEIGDRVTRPAS